MEECSKGRLGQGGLQLLGIRGIHSWRKRVNPLPDVLNEADHDAGLLIAVKKQANIAAWEGQWDRCLAMGFCNLGGCADRARARGRHLVAVFFVPARWAR